MSVPLGDVKALLRLCLLPQVLVVASPDVQANCIAKTGLPLADYLTMRSLEGLHEFTYSWLR